MFLAIVGSSQSGQAVTTKQDAKIFNPAHARVPTCQHKETEVPTRTQTQHRRYTNDNLTSVLSCIDTMQETETASVAIRPVEDVGRAGFDVSTRSDGVLGKRRTLHTRLERPWEKMFQEWRKKLIMGNVTGKVLELGIDSGRNLKYYAPSPELMLTAVDSRKEMLKLAKSRQPSGLNVDFVESDIQSLPEEWESSFDWVVSTFAVGSVDSDSQPGVYAELNRVLKPGGRFRVLEIVYSRKTIVRLYQSLTTPKLSSNGRRFLGRALVYLKGHPDLSVDRVEYLKGDTHVLIEGHKPFPDEKQSKTLKDQETSFPKLLW